MRRRVGKGIVRQERVCRDHYAEVSRQNAVSTDNRPGEAIAANQICQSIRGWYGATNGGRRLGSPGLALNSYSFHFVSPVMSANRPFPQK